MLTNFDWKAWRKFHLDKFPELTEMLEGSNNLEDIEQHLN
jgi:hypothetical protein